MKKIFTLVFVFGCLIISNLHADNLLTMKERLQKLKYSFVEEENWYSIQTKTHNVLISKKATRDVEQDNVCYVMGVFYPYEFFHDDHIKIICTKEHANWMIFDSSIEEKEEISIVKGYLGYVIYLDENCSEQELKKAIRECATAKRPIEYDIDEQRALAILDVMIKFSKAPKSSLSVIISYMKKIDLSMCPADFQNAVTNFIDICANKSETATAVGGALGTLAGEDEAGQAIGSLFGSLIGSLVDDDIHKEKIDTAWENILDITEKYIQLAAKKNK